MSPNRASQRAFAVFALLTALVLASVPAGARTVRQPAQHLHGVAALGESSLAGIWRFLANLLPQGLRKEGVLIDPNGAPNHGSTPATPAAALNDEGMSIDPNG